MEVRGLPEQIVHEIPIFKNNQSKMEWRCGSSGRAPALEDETPIPQKKKKSKKSIHLAAGCTWLTPVILATQKAEIRSVVWYRGATPGALFLAGFRNKLTRHG
jgi:hypothetical protein